MFSILDVASSLSHSWISASIQPVSLMTSSISSDTLISCTSFLKCSIIATNDSSFACPLPMFGIRSTARSASQKLHSLDDAYSCTRLILVSPIPRFGTFTIRLTARSSLPLSIVLRYARRSLISRLAQKFTPPMTLYGILSRTKRSSNIRDCALVR